MRPSSLTEEEVIELRNNKIELNRKSRRVMGMRTACEGKTTGLLECRTAEGTCPDFDMCHS